MANGTDKNGFSFEGFLRDHFLSKAVWAFLLLPGFVSYVSARLIAPLDPPSELEVLAYSFTFLLVNLAVTLTLFVVVSRVHPLWWHSQQVGQIASTAIFTATLLAVSLITGVVGGVMLERDIFFKFAAALPFLTAPVQDSVHSPLDRILLQNHLGIKKDTYADNRSYEGDRGHSTTQAYTRITTIGGAIYEGWPNYFDSRRREEQIYLTPACLLIETKNGTEVLPIKGPGVVIFERDIRSVVLLDKRATRCSSYWATPPSVRGEIAEIAGLTWFGRETDAKAVFDNIKNFCDAATSQVAAKHEVCQAFDGAKTAPTTSDPRWDSPWPYGMAIVPKSGISDSNRP